MSLFLTTVRLLAHFPDRPDDSGTAFWVSSASNRLYLATAGHVIKGSTVVDLEGVACKVGTNPSEPVWGKGVNHQTEGSSWLVHPSMEYDVAVLPAPKLFEQQVAHRFVQSSMFLTGEVLQFLHDIDDVVVIGYPDGQRSDRTKSPLAISGKNAEPFGIPVDVSDELAIAVQVFGGSSGSPVFFHARNRHVPASLMSPNAIIETRDLVSFVGVVVAGRTVAQRVDATDHERTVSAAVFESLGIAQVLRHERLTETMAAVEAGEGVSAA